MDDTRRCTARSKRSHRRCKRAAVVGRTVCSMHGGKTPSGFALPQTTHGGYSKDLPTQLAGRYAAAVQDPDLLSLRHGIALTESMIGDLLGKLSTGEAAVVWQHLKLAKAAYEDAAAHGNLGDMHQQLDRMGRLIDQGASQVELFDAVGRQLDRARQLRETETRRLVSMQQVITTERAMLLFGQVVEILRKHVSDRAVLGAIQADFRRLTADPAG